MKLVKPCEKYLASYRDAVREDERYRADVETTLGNPDEIIEKAYRYDSAIDLPEGHVRGTMLWLVEGDKFIGQIDIRHELTSVLKQYGGHIGYEVRYSESGKGYGSKMLAMALDYVKDELKLKRVLLTCDDDNMGSIRVIEKNGGVLEDKIINKLQRGEVVTRRYWIEL